MLRIGITGQSGFIGTHLYNTLGLTPDKYERIPFEDGWFEDGRRLEEFVSCCDVVVHLAAMNRNPDPQIIYDTNIALVRQLIEAMERSGATPHVLFSSSIQEEKDNEYGRGKREGRLMFEQWALRSGARFTGLVIPNVFGAFGLPNYNSFVATFCHRLVSGVSPEIMDDSMVKLIYVGSLVDYIIHKIDECGKSVERCFVPYDFEKRVSEVLALLVNFKELYFDNGFIPALADCNEVNLFNTFRSYINYEKHFPRYLTQHSDDRGVFVETLKLGIGGQVSFSTTVPGITRGDHYHTRKIERFMVIKGQVAIKMRRTGDDKVLEFRLDGSNPSYVDMPIWFTHNITNIGEEEMYCQFWINEWYDPSDADTYFERVEK